MRFPDIEYFSVEELSLDEGNYRFRMAQDQKKCIDKIYNQNPNSFINLMDSIGKKDIAYPLLVYRNNGKNIVMDGNRRLAALKVLFDPDTYAPASNIINRARELNRNSKVDFNKITAQVSDNKVLIDETIYDIHAAGGGVSQVGWTAYANACFRLQHGLEKGADVYPTAILLKIEDEYAEEWTDFLTSHGFYETFVRIFKNALREHYISTNIFSADGIREDANRENLSDALNKSIAILKSIKNKEIGLSRREDRIYASPKGIKEYFQTKPDIFSISPDNKTVAEITGPLNPEKSFVDRIVKVDIGAGKKEDLIDIAVNKVDTQQNDTKSEYGINRSSRVEEYLGFLKTEKLQNLYNSLCILSLNKHPTLLYVGAWSFFEALARLLGASEGTSFVDFLCSKANNDLSYSRDKRKEIKKSLTDISEIGNLSKHSPQYYRDNAKQLKIDFNTLEAFIIDIITLALKNNCEKERDRE